MNPKVLLSTEKSHPKQIAIKLLIALIYESIFFYRLTKQVFRGFWRCVGTRLLALPGRQVERAKNPLNIYHFCHCYYFINQFIILILFRICDNWLSLNFTYLLGNFSRQTKRLKMIVKWLICLNKHSQILSKYYSIRNSLC